MSPSVTEIRSASVSWSSRTSDRRLSLHWGYPVTSSPMTAKTSTINLDDSSEYIIKVEVANETMNTSDVTPEYGFSWGHDVKGRLRWGYQVNQGRWKWYNKLTPTELTRCEAHERQKFTISQETTNPELETPLPLFNRHVMTTGMRVWWNGQIWRPVGYKWPLWDKCSSVSEIVDEVLIEDVGDVGL